MWIETVDSTNINIQPKVTPHVGVWIETLEDSDYTTVGFVTPHVGVWIETYNYETDKQNQSKSHLM